MSIWPEIKKAINSDLSTPLNHLMWLNDYKIFGESSYVFQNKDILHELYRDYELCANDGSILYEALKFAELSGSAGKLLSKVNGIESAETIATLGTFSEILSNDTSRAAIFNNESLIRVLGVPIVLEQIGYNQTNKNTFEDIVRDGVAMTAIVSSGSAMNYIAKMGHVWDFVKPFILAVNSPIHLKTLFNTLSDTTYFTRKIATVGTTGPDSNLSEYGMSSYAKDGFICCALSYYHNTEYVGNLFVNDTFITRGLVGSSNSYTEVTKNNITGVGIPTTRFGTSSSSGDNEKTYGGKAAIAVFIAN